MVNKLIFLRKQFHAVFFIDYFPVHQIGSQKSF